MAQRVYKTLIKPAPDRDEASRGHRGRRAAQCRRLGPVTGEPGELAALRDAFPGYRFRRRDCAVRFGISQRRVTAVLERHGVPRRPVGRPPRRLPAGRPGETARK